MRYLKYVAVFVALIDLAFAVYFFARPEVVPGAESAPELLRWLAVCLLGSAASLGLLTSDIERYLPLAFVNAGARILAILVGLPAIARQLAVIVSQVAVAALFIGVLAYELKKQRRK